MSTILSLAFLTGAPGPAELIVIFVVILLLFGPKRLPSIAKSIGKTLDELRRASQDFKDQIMSIDEDEHEPTPVDVESEEILPFGDPEAEAGESPEGERDPADAPEAMKAGEDDADSGESKHDLVG